MPTAPTKPPPQSNPPPADPARRAKPHTQSHPTIGLPSADVTPPRILFAAVEGWGKTTLGAHAPGSLMILAEGESGYLTLASRSRVPQVPTVTIATWPELIGLLDGLADDCPYQTIVLDALGGFESQCHQHICDTEYDGNWGDQGFSAYAKGFGLSANEWLKLLARLEKLQQRHSVAVILLAHVQIKTFSNPNGPDFDRYETDLHRKTYAPTAKWADAILFGQFVTLVDKVVASKTTAKGKGIGFGERVVYTEHRDAWDAKNRFGMPEQITIPNDSDKVYSTIFPT